MTIIIDVLVTMDDQKTGSKNVNIDNYKRRNLDEGLAAQCRLFANQYASFIGR